MKIADRVRAFGDKWATGSLFVPSRSWLYSGATEDNYIIRIFRRYRAAGKSAAWVVTVLDRSADLS